MPKFRLKRRRKMSEGLPTEEMIEIDTGTARNRS
jgi:hypothetical protein